MGLQYDTGEGLKSGRQGQPAVGPPLRRRGALRGGAGAALVATRAGSRLWFAVDCQLSAKNGGGAYRCLCPVQLYSPDLAGHPIIRPFDPNPPSLLPRLILHA